MFKLERKLLPLAGSFHEKDQMAEHDNLVDIPEYIRKEKFLEASRFATNFLNLEEQTYLFPADTGYENSR